MKTDARIQRDVLQELEWDARIDAGEITVSVERDVVLVTGTAQSFGEKREAQEAAHRVKGVLDVVNEIELKTPASGGPSDAEIAHAMRRRLAWDVFLPAARIQSTVSGGWVTLGGTVGNWREKKDAEGAAFQLAGVRGVTNEIRIAGPKVEPEVIHAAIEAALSRRGHHVDEHLQVRVDGTIVTLTGSVRGWDEKYAILGAVAHAPGVQALHDRLRVTA